MCFPKFGLMSYFLVMYSSSKRVSLNIREASVPGCNLSNFVVDICSSFHSVPLSLVFNKVMTEGYLLGGLEVCTIDQFLRRELCNHRPASLTIVLLVNVTESVVNNFMVSCFSSYSLISISQHGFFFQKRSHASPIFWSSGKMLLIVH